MKTSVLIAVFITALGYWLLGISAGFFAIPPGYASPIWPASGFAFFMLLRHGAWNVFGIFCASFALNLKFSGASLFVYSDAWPLAASIAFGASLQGLVAQLSVLRFTRYPKLSTQFEDTLLVGLLGGPLACTLSPSIGVASLYLSGILPAQELAINWANWWVGDTIGVLVFCPIIIAISLGITWLKHSKLATFFSIYLFSIIIASALFVQVRASEAQKIEALFQQKVATLHRSIAKQLNSVQHTSLSLAALIQTFPDIDFEHFFSYTSNAFKDDKGTQAQSWIPIVSAAQRARFERDLTRYHNQELHFYEMSETGEKIPAKKRDVYYPVYFIEPIHGNEKAVGFDLGSNPSRLTAIQQAIQSKTPVATEPIELVQEKDKQNAILLITPVFDRQHTLLGFVSSVYRANDIIDAALEGLEQEGISVTIVDTTETAKSFPFYSANAHSLPSNENASQIKKVITFAHRRWTASYTVTNEFLRNHQTGNAWIILVAGFLIATLFGLFILVVMGRSAQIEKEVKEKTHALNEALKKAESASAVKTAFLANVSHELRTPLNSIIGFSTRILKSHKDELSNRVQDALEIVQRNGQHLLALINDILDISKVEAGRMELQKAPCDLAMLCDEALKALSPQAEAKSLQLTRGQLPVNTIHADEKRLRQILINLLSNAIKFTHKGSVSMVFSLATQDSVAGINIAIEDTGKGIPEAEQGKLFKRFEQLGNSFQAGEMSTGLGLALTQELVSLHQGKITINSTPDIGSTFTVWLPLS